MSFSSPNTSALPSVGPPLSSWSTSSTRRGGVQKGRQQKLGLWSAVALQQHFTTTGGRRGRPLPPTEEENAAENSSYGGATSGEERTTEAADLRSHLGPAGGLAGHAHKPTLAQRMGLVPPPPPAPTADDWRVVVHRAMLREQHGARDARGHGAGTAAAASSSSSSVCSICQMSFLATSDEGQVILSCSHVFHAQCFRAFERCVRAQQRADGVGVAEVTAQLACPVCRTQHYYKRVFYEGKAMTQRAAIVKVQSAIRAFLARRVYVHMRLQSNAEFRTRYVQERLARLSAAWSAFCAQQDRHREATLVALAVQHQAAAAAYLTESQWACIWQNVLQKYKEADTSGGGALSDACGSGSDPIGDRVIIIPCPICLERIYATHFTQEQSSCGEGEGLDASGDDAVAALRLAYEQRRNATKEQAAVSTRLYADTQGSAGKKKARMKKGAAAPPPTASKFVASVPNAPLKPQRKDTTELATPPVVALPALTPSQTRPPTLTAGPQSGVLLSCGHCFHSACLGCYERYNEQRMTEAASNEHATGSVVVIADRCPICRSGYAKHPL